MEKTRKATIAVDIETVASPKGLMIIEKTEFKAASNVKDPAKKEAQISEKKAKAIDRAALSWWTGKAICISAVGVDNDISKVWYGDDESEVLGGFFDFLAEMNTHTQLTLTGKNSMNFDFPYLIGRAIELELGIPSALRATTNQRMDMPNDVDHIFGRSSRCEQSTSLANYGYAIGIPKTGSGGDVAGMYKEGMWDEISKYCTQDSMIVAEMLRRYSKVYRLRRL